VAVRTILGAVALQILAVAELLTTGVGFTVTIIVKAASEQDPEVEVGVTKYCTVPAVALLGLVKI
jgi:ABC-type proline/glycine betaine transport system permease subunit